MVRLTLPERRQRVHTFNFTGFPLISVLTVCKLGAQVFLERLCEWLTFIPVRLPLLQISHLLAISSTSLRFITPLFYQKQVGKAREKIIHSDKRRYIYEKSGVTNVT
jgi:hypothetical protein